MLSDIFLPKRSNECRGDPGSLKSRKLGPVLSAQINNSSFVLLASQQTGLSESEGSSPGALSLEAFVFPSRGVSERLSEPAGMEPWPRVRTLDRAPPPRCLRLHSVSKKAAGMVQDSTL